MVFLIGEPAVTRISRLLGEQRDVPFFYAEVGASWEAPGEIPGYTVDHHRVGLGGGEQAFGRAVEALFAWKMFVADWVGLFLPPAALDEAGTTVGVLARHHGFWSPNL